MPQCGGRMFGKKHIDPVAFCNDVVLSSIPVFRETNTKEAPVGSPRRSRRVAEPMTSTDALPTSFSLFYRAQDNDPKARTTTWLGFREGFKKHQVVSSKDSVALWSPATFRPGTPRRQVNVVEVAFAVADIDS